MFGLLFLPLPLALAMDSDYILDWNDGVGMGQEIADAQKGRNLGLKNVFSPQAGVVIRPQLNEGTLENWGQVT